MTHRFFGMSPPESPSQHLSDFDLHPFLSSSLPFTPANQSIPSQPLQQSASFSVGAVAFANSLEPELFGSLNQNQLSRHLSAMAIDDYEAHSPLTNSYSQISLQKSHEELPIFSMDDVILDNTALGVNPMDIYNPPPDESNLPIPTIQVDTVKKMKPKNARIRTNEIKPLFSPEQLQSLTHEGLLGISQSSPIPVPATTPTLSTEQHNSFALSPPSPSTPLSPSLLLSTSPVDLIISQAVQGPDGMFGCICGKRYGTLVALKNHAKLHGFRERNFFCSICNKAFLRKQDLRRHETTHLDDYHPYACENCGTTFTRSDALSRHLKARRCK